MNVFRSRLLDFLLLVVILTGCGIGSDSDSDASDDALYQVSTLSALSAGGYDGLVTLDEMLEEGDFGLGTFDALDGEMIVLDGTVYQVPSNGIAQEPDGDVTTPFAVVTPWDADSEHEFADSMSCADLQSGIDELIDASMPYAIKVEGRFSTLLTRSEESQEPPYAPLEEVLQGQIEFQLDDVDATMAGFRLPDYMANANAAGYHFHALTSDEQAGGHVLDCQASGVTVELDAIDSWQVDLP